MSKDQSPIPVERIERPILVIRGHRVILDEDLAPIYGVTTKRLNQQVRRNSDRFPEDFAFLLTGEEFADLKLHFATSSSGWGGRRKPPFAYLGGTGPLGWTRRRTLAPGHRAVGEPGKAGVTRNGPLQEGRFLK